MEQIKTFVKKVSVPSDKKTKQKEYLATGKLPIIDQGQALIGGYTNDETKTVVCDLPVIVFGDHTCCVKYIDFPFGAGADGIKVIKPNPDLLPKYLYYGMQYLVLKLSDRGYGRHYQHLEKTMIYVPPIPKQEKIVSQIEESLSQLDSAVETLKKTKQQLDVYRQAVLKEVFSTFDTVEIQSVCKHVTDGDHMPPPKAEQGIPFIMISNIIGNTIDWSNTAFVSKEYYDNIGDKRTPKKGDVLYTVTGSFGIPVLIDFEKEFCFQRHIALLRPNEMIDQEFLYYALQDSSVYSQASKRATGTAQKTVGLTVLRKIEIPFTESLDTQLQIVERTKQQLSMCDHIEQTVNQSLQQAEALRQSILKQVFEF